MPWHKKNLKTLTNTNLKNIVLIGKLVITAKTLLTPVEFKAMLAHFVLLPVMHKQCDWE